MQHSRFLVLTGHLNDYPLSDLVGILRHQHKTGRLLIEYPNGPASFFFNDGELVDAQLDKLTGLQALCVAQAQPPSSFNFNPLIRPTKRSIERSAQRVVSELLGCWSENDVEVEELPARPAPAALPSVAATSTVGDLVAKTDEALVFSAFTEPVRENSYNHLILGMAAAGLLMLGLSTVIAVTGGWGTRLSPAQVTPKLSSATERNITPSGSGELTQPQPDTADQTESSGERQAGKGKEVAKTLQLAAPLKNQVSSSQSEKTASLEGVSAPLTAEPQKHEKEKQPGESAAETQSVKVVLEIESGRVAKASIANHRPGMEAYEAMALRIARQRRYPAAGTTQETVTIKVSQPK